MDSGPLYFLSNVTDDRQRLLCYAYMRLAREVDSRFEKLLLSGRVAKWYSEVGNEATTVSAGLAIGRGDVLCTLHRDLGAILAYYLDPVRTFPGFGFGEEADHRPAPRELLYRLVCQLLGRADGFSGGVERSYHYGYLAPEMGLNHVGMISHLGAMIPVAAGCAFALKRSGTDRVAVNFIGDGGTSTGDFHEGLNMAAVWNLPLVLVIENNRYAFSTPVASTRSGSHATAARRTASSEARGLAPRYRASAAAETWQSLSWMTRRQWPKRADMVVVLMAANLDPEGCACNVAAAAVCATISPH